MESVLTVRVATSADLPVLQALIAAYAAELQPGGEVPDPRHAAASLGRLMLSSAGAVWIAQRGDVPVGFAAGSLSISPWRPAMVGELVFLFVQPGVRGGSAAARLLQAFEQWARRQGAAVLGIADTGEALGRAVVRRGYRVAETRYLRRI